MTLLAPGEASPDPPRLPGGFLLAERYLIERVLGRGGYADVYLARDVVLEQPVALKVLRGDRLGETDIARLRREAAVAREADDPHLVRVHDLVRCGELVFLVIEPMTGGSLDERLEAGPLPIDEVVALAEQSLLGLAALHHLGIVHRDVKPANLLLGAEGRLKLADFGIARAWDRDERRLTETATLVGTAEYLAPEQAMGEAADPRSDLYSLGVVLYELLTGRLPHPGRSAFEALLARVSRVPEDVRRHRRETPDWLSRVVARLLERRPEDRYPSAEAVLTDLRRRRARRSPRRRRRLAWTAGVALAALALGGSGVWSTAVPPRPRFSHLAQDTSGLRALAEDGSLLWERPGRRAAFVAARLDPSGPVRVVGIDVEPGGRSPAETHRLVILEAETGRRLEEVELPSGSGAFQGFSDWFWPNVTAEDLDGDGADEILVSYHHVYWPSYTVLWEPRIDRRRLLLVASGHHRPAGATDVDGDGRRELLFAGWANRMGWYNALAAVALDPPVNEDSGRRAGALAHTPDRERGPWQALQWYALLPPGTCPVTSGCYEIDEAARVVRFEAVRARTVEVGFDGFVRGPTSRLAPAARAAVREDAYRRAAEAQRLIETGAPGAAVGEADRAAARAAAVGDPVLAEWARRLEGQALARAGETAAADALFAELLRSAGSPADVAFDAARAFHLSGALERAVGWYRRGFGADPTGGLGRHRYELLEGLVFALGELGRWSEARQATRRYSPGEDDPALRTWIYSSWIDWRRGAPVTLPEVAPRDCDLDRYLALEVAFHHGEPSAQLLERTVGELERASETEPLLLSLQAVLLADLGRSAEAIRVARRAWEAAETEALWSTIVRGHRALIASRYATLLEAAGRAPEAAAVRAAAGPSAARDSSG